MSDRHMGPGTTPERRLGYPDEPVGECRVLVSRKVGRIPDFQVPEHAETEVARLVVAGEIHPDGGIVVGFVGYLDRVAKPRFEVLVGVEVQPEGNGTGPITVAERDILVS